MKNVVKAGLSALFVAIVALGGISFAQQPHGGHAGHGSTAGTGKDTPATMAFKSANAKMHKDMDIAYSGDVEADFVRGMIPHHQGAIDMARVMLAHGKDPELRKLATTIVAEQEKEIATMRAWLKANGR
jgi:uncharacterized protein (DUF305 family)